MSTFKCSRRDFSRALAGMAGATACGFLPVSGSAMSLNGKKESIGIQLYSLRALTSKDFKGTIAKVAEIGYDSVEFAGYGDLSAKEVKAMLKDLGLKCAGTHEGFGGLGDKLEQTIEFNLGIGNPNIVCPSMPGEFRENADGFKRFGEAMNKIGEKVTAAGMKLLYHNHSFEFKKENGSHLFDSFLKAADPKLVQLEVDIYWVNHGGVNPAAFVREHSDRIGMLHMKDMTADNERTFAPVGTGVIDMPAVIKAGRECGVKWFVVEQDRTKRPPLDAVKISHDNLRKLLS